MATCLKCEAHVWLAPAQDVLEYEVKVLTADFGPSPYKGLSDEVDRAWKDLYDHREANLQLFW